MVSDNELCDPLSLDDPPGARTPPTLPVVLLLLLQCDNVPWRTLGRYPYQISCAPWRERIPYNGVHEIADFDRHYMPGGLPSPDAFARGNADDHRPELKRKADGISRSLSEVCLPDTWDCVTGGGKEAVDYPHKC